ncbi:MAG TPA: hypothetical protein VF545_08670 [Thermoleophilaceae bacterium]|jgi:hypothetical protein
MKLRRRRNLPERLYHRRETPDHQTPEVAAQQVRSQEVWGGPPAWGARPRVKAFVGPLPDEYRGIEFATDVEPDPNTPPTWAYWSRPEAGVRIEGDVAKISVRITKNTQV